MYIYLHACQILKLSYCKKYSFLKDFEQYIHIPKALRLVYMVKLLKSGIVKYIRSHADPEISEITKYIIVSSSVPHLVPKVWTRFVYPFPSGIVRPPVGSPLERQNMYCLRHVTSCTDVRHLAKILFQYLLADRFR